MPLKVEIITPEGIAWNSDSVDSVILPTTSGEIQILEGHIPLLTELQAGAAVVTNKGNSENLAIDKGYARVVGDVVSVLTEAAINVEQIDEAQAENQRQEALKELEKMRTAMYVDDEEIEKLEALARFSIAQKLAKAKKRS